MKTSMRKLRGLGLHKHDAKVRGDPLPLVPQLDELARASQDMQDMRDCYDSLLSAAAATANSAYEFSESLQEMGACLLEKTALNDDEESGKVLLMLGKVQFQLKKLVGSYRSHIVQTITSPSESLLNELRIVEEMKRQCDEKRDVYEYMRMRQKEKGRSRTKKGDTFSGQQVQAARDEYDEEATLFVFRLKSLKQGQSRSLLTQAARHHAAQLCFFKKALNSLETVDPDVKSVTEQQHIDYLFSGLDDDGGDDDDDDDDDDSYDVLDDGELSFDYGQNDHDQDFSISPRPIELDQVNLALPQVEAVKENLNRPQRSYFPFRAKTGSQSAPLFPENRSEIAEKIKQMQPTTREFHTYVLPTPVGTRSSISPKSHNLVTPSTIQTGINKHEQNMYHSSPLDPRKYEKIDSNEKTSGPTVMNPQSILRESNNKTTHTTRLPLPSTDGLLFPRNKRQAFSGPITGKPWPTKVDPMDHHPQLFSGPILRSATPQPPPPSSSTSKVSHVASPTFLSSPKISELHELPRPPINSLTLRSSRSLIPHSAPLTSKGQVVLAVSNGVATKAAASTLPTPPQSMARSTSIRSRDHMERSLTSQNSVRLQDIASPPLTPIALSTSQVKASAD